MAEGGAVEVGDASIGYAIERRPRRRKTLEMRTTGPRSVIIAAPASTPVAVIEAFVRARVKWVLRRSERVPEASPAPTGGLPPQVRYRGAQYRLDVIEECGSRPVVTLRGEAITIATRGGLGEAERADVARRALDVWFRERAAGEVGEAVERWSLSIRRTPRRVLIRSQKRRWGSCAPDGTLRFNWRVVTLAPDLLEYIVVHELVHLEVMNHSPAFWKRVGELMPGYAEQRQRLRTEERVDQGWQDATDR